MIYNIKLHCNSSAHIAQQVEHILGKNGVIGSNPIVGCEQMEVKDGKTEVFKDKAALQCGHHRSC